MTPTIYRVPQGAIEPSHDLATCGDPRLAGYSAKVDEDGLQLLELARAVICEANAKRVREALEAGNPVGYRRALQELRNLSWFWMPDTHGLPRNETAREALKVRYRVRLSSTAVLPIIDGAADHPELAEILDALRSGPAAAAGVPVAA